MTPSMNRSAASQGVPVRAAREIGTLALAAAALVVVGAAGFWWNSAGPAKPGRASQQAIAALQDVALHAPRTIDGDAESIGAVASAAQSLDALVRDRALGELSADPRLARVVAGGGAIGAAETPLLAAGTARREIGGLAARFSEELRRAVEVSPAQAGLESVARAVERAESRAREIDASLGRLFDGGPQAQTAARRLAEASAYLGQVLRGFAGTDPAASLPRLQGAQAAAALNAAQKTQARIEALVREAVGAAPALPALADNARTLAVDSTSLSRDLAGAPVAGGALAWWPAVPALLALVPLVLLLRRSAELRREAEQQRLAAAVQRKEADRNQEAILRLLDELSSLADGDLTVQATVTEDITGAIADSINYAVDALRGLVTTINKSAIQLDGAARQTTALAQHLAKASSAQSKQIGSATESVAEMAAFTEEVSGNAERAADVARHSVDVAHKGGDAVRRTIDGMNTIRETIQETSKRIKRLGESSQEIGNIVELINDIAEQTNILALNASIQASMAGEAGRGFAVVADEVQRLAERAANATKQIEVLVRTIQADTNEAVVSMERSTTDVVGGALLAENAGAALEEIEQVSNQIASLVQNISGSARQQSIAAQNITRNMQVLREISTQTADSTSATSQSIAKLAELSAGLRSSVAGFRLPGTADAGRRVDRPAPTEDAVPARLSGGVSGRVA
jgi:twitching motility protein PilJ